MFCQVATYLNVYPVLIVHAFDGISSLALCLVAGWTPSIVSTPAFVFPTVYPLAVCLDNNVAITKIESCSLVEVGDGVKVKAIEQYQRVIRGNRSNMC